MSVKLIVSFEYHTLSYCLKLKHDVSFLLHCFVSSLTLSTSKVATRQMVRERSTDTLSERDDDNDKVTMKITNSFHRDDQNTIHQFINLLDCIFVQIRYSWFAYSQDPTFAIRFKYDSWSISSSYMRDMTRLMRKIRKIMSSDLSPYTRKRHVKTPTIHLKDLLFHYVILIYERMTIIDLDTKIFLTRTDECSKKMTYCSIP